MLRCGFVILNNIIPGSETCYDDLSCSIVAGNDKQGLEAIRSLHRQLDDDANGAVDLSESDDVSLVFSSSCCSSQC